MQQRLVHVLKIGVNPKPASNGRLTGENMSDSSTIRALPHGGQINLASSPACTNRSYNMYRRPFRK